MCHQRAAVNAVTEPFATIRSSLITKRVNCSPRDPFWWATMCKKHWHNIALTNTCATSNNYSCCWGLQCVCRAWWIQVMFLLLIKRLLYLSGEVLDVACRDNKPKAWNANHMRSCGAIMRKMNHEIRLTTWHECFCTPLNKWRLCVCVWYLYKCFFPRLLSCL